MSLTPYDLAVIAGVFTIAGALIAVLAGHFLAKKLASYTYRLNKLDEVKSSIILNYNAVYPVVSEWPVEISDYLKVKTPTLCGLIQQCESHMGLTEFSDLILARDKFLNDIKGFIAKQNDVAELFYNDADPKKGQARLHEHINCILGCIK